MRDEVRGRDKHDGEWVFVVLLAVVFTVGLRESFELNYWLSAVIGVAIGVAAGIAYRQLLHRRSREDA